MLASGAVEQAMDKRGETKQASRGENGNVMFFNVMFFNVMFFDAFCVIQFSESRQ